MILVVSLIGNWVDWEIPWHVRIKHLPTKKYLVLVKNDVVSNNGLIIWLVIILVLLKGKIVL